MVTPPNRSPGCAWSTRRRASSRHQLSPALQLCANQDGTTTRECYSFVVENNQLKTYAWTGGAVNIHQPGMTLDGGGALSATFMNAGEIGATQYGVDFQSAGNIHMGGGAPVRGKFVDSLISIGPTGS